MVHLFNSRKRVANHNVKKLKEIETIEAAEFMADDYFADIVYINKKRMLQLNNRTVTQKDKLRLEKDTRAEDKLIIKIGCRVMLIKNIDVSKGFANGSLGIVTGIDRKKEDDVEKQYIIVKFDNKKTLRIEKEDFEIPFDEKTVLVRNQYPLVLAYAMTIHKSQGLSFDEVVVDIANCFACGQAYVALSRARTKEGLTILNNNTLIGLFADNDVINFYNQIIIANTNNEKDATRK